MTRGIAIILWLMTMLASAGAARAQHTGGAHTGGAHTGGAHTGGAHTGGGARPGPVDPFSARYTEASRAWHEQRYEEALRLFTALHEETRRAELLYDLGLTYERLDRLREAIDSFQGYVDALPMARNRMQVEDRIASLRQDLDEREGRIATPTAPRTTPRASERPIMTLMGEDAEQSRPDPATAARQPPRTETVVEGGGPEWIVTWPFLGLTAVSAITAGIAWDQGWQALRALEDECLARMGCTENAIGESSARAWETATNALLVTSIVLGAATLITFIAEAASPTDSRIVERTVSSVRIDLGLGRLSIEGSF